MIASIVLDHVAVVMYFLVLDHVAVVLYFLVIFSVVIAIPIECNALT